MTQEPSPGGTARARVDGEAQPAGCCYLLDNAVACPRPRAPGSEFCAQHSLPADLEVYRVVTDHFKQDLREFWSRSNFYLVVQAGLVSAFGAIVPKASESQRALALTIAGVGLAVAVFWLVVARGAVTWIRLWRAEVVRLDALVDRHRVYERIERLVDSNPLMSPSRVTQYLPVIFCVGWVALITTTIVTHT
jgi:hypothetical protein